MQKRAVSLLTNRHVVCLPRSLCFAFKIQVVPSMTSRSRAVFACSPQVPVNYISEETFSAISVYLIPKPELQHKLITV